MRTTITKRFFLVTCLLICLSLILNAALTATAKEPVRQNARSLIEELETGIADDTLTEEQVIKAREDLPKIIKQARECIDNRQNQLEESRQRLTTLGKPLDNESETLKSARKNINQNIVVRQKQIADCKLLQVESETLIRKLEARDTQELADILSTRKAGIFTHIIRQPHPYGWFNSLLETEFHHLGLEYLSAAGLAIFITITLALLFASRLIKRHWLPKFDTPLPEAGLSNEILGAFLATISKYLTGLLVFAGWSVFWLVNVGEQRPMPQLAVVSFSLFGLVLALYISRSFFSPISPSRHYLPIEEDLSRKFWVALRYLILVVAISTAIFNSPFYEGLSEPILVLARAIDAVIFTACLIWVIWLAFTLNSIRGIGLFRPLVTLALVVGIFAELLGYQNLSSYIIGGIFFSVFALALTWVANRLVTDFLDGLDQGHYRWEQNLRDRMGLAETQPMPGLIWIRLISVIFIWGGYLYVLLRIWGLNERGETLLFRYLNEGFSIGPLTIVPRQIAIALVFFTLLLAIVAWLKQQLDKNWLSRTRINRGAREAAITISGYVGVALALIIALSVAGVDFKNLAIIAGALSVGIGFGLQNIVNNFVSGLILLFERPISTGDWIVVGNTQGYVKSINIRSTQIMTFDRADVIVPNSELISGQVTNWMLRDLSGRACVPIGVAYGTDTALVKKVLLEVASQHPAPIKDGSLPEPYVLFLGFGDSSLNFELRFFIAEVDNRINVISDINFAIDAAFREAGIEIPFPQRDVHIKNIPPERANQNIEPD